MSSNNQSNSSNKQNTNRFVQQYDKRDYQVISRDSCFKGFFSLDKVALKHRRFEGGWSQVIEREIFIRGNATCVLPYDPLKDTVVLVEQFRPGMILEDSSPWALELIAGMNEKGEEPLGVAKREAKEEADLELGEIEKICEYLVSPGGTTEKVYLYCSKINSESAGGVHGLEEEHEDIKVHVLSLPYCMELIESGKINNAAAIIGLQWLWINKARLKAKWV